MSAPAEKTWDVIVIGAGPAGALAARQLALSGCRVLLVEKKSFPRDKVCGACLNPQAMSVLEAAGLGDLVAARGGVPLTRFSLRAGSSPLEIPLSGGRSLSRAVLDAALVSAATAAGAVFQSLTEAHVERPKSAGQHERIVRLVRAGASVERVTAKIVLVADGLSRSSVSDWPEFSGGVDEHSHIGIGAIVSGGGDSLECGTICMSVAREGYVGMVRVEDGRLNVAAAISPRFVKACGGPELAVTACLREAGAPVSFFGEANWLGTVPMTRRASCVATSRVLLLGDAAGYVEPFTGEGIAWALTAALAVVPLVRQGLQHDNFEVEPAWSRVLVRDIQARQQWCRGFAWCLRHRHLVQLAVTSLRTWPAAGRWLADKIQQPIRS